MLHDLLRQSEPERDAIHALVDRRNSPGGGGGVGGGAGAAKLTARTTIPCESLVVQIEQLGGSVASFRVWPRDLSATGIGFVHGSFVHSGVRCAVMLPTLDGRKVTVNGQVARCEYIKGRAHLVGVRFEESIPLHEFVPGIDPPKETVAKPGKGGRGEPVRELKTMVAELLALCGHRDCPPQMRKLIREIAERVGK